MNDQIAMRESNRLADFVEKIQPLIQITDLFAAEIVNRQAFDVFHHQKRNAVVGRSGVEQAGDIRMIERDENFVFAAGNGGECFRCSIRA